MKLQWHTVKMILVNKHTRYVEQAMVQHQDMDHQANTSVLERHPRQTPSNSSRPAHSTHKQKLTTDKRVK